MFTGMFSDCLQTCLQTVYKLFRDCLQVCLQTVYSMFTECLQPCLQTDCLQTCLQAWLFTGMLTDCLQTVYRCLQTDCSQTCLQTVYRHDCLQAWLFTGMTVYRHDCLQAWLFTGTLTDCLQTFSDMFTDWLTHSLSPKPKHEVFWVPTDVGIGRSLTHSRLTPSFWKCSQGLEGKTPIVDQKANVPWIILVQKLFDRK